MTENDTERPEILTLNKPKETNELKKKLIGKKRKLFKYILSSEKKITKKNIEIKNMSLNNIDINITQI